MEERIKNLEIVINVLAKELDRLETELEKRDAYYKRAIEAIADYTHERVGLRRDFRESQE